MRAVKLYILCIIFKTLIYVKEKEALRIDLGIGSNILRSTGDKEQSVAYNFIKI